MSHIFLPTLESFTAHSLRFGAYHVLAGASDNFPCIVAIDPGTSSQKQNLLLRVHDLLDAPDVEWALLVGRGQRVLLNGQPLDLDLALLRHQDDLRVNGSPPLYFSSERLASVEPCPRLDLPRCPRCAQSIACGDPAVCCPGCGVFHHQLADLPCWTYAARCARCEVPSDLDAELRWTPVDI